MAGSKAFSTMMLLFVSKGEAGIVFVLLLRKSETFDDGRWPDSLTGGKMLRK